MTETGGVTDAEDLAAAAAGGNGKASEGPEFTLELNQDQKDIKTGSTASPRASYVPLRRSGTSARKRPGRSFRRPPRSASTASKRSPSSGLTKPG